ncbi:hypothetical protein [Pedobacter jamesrossensis]|uniref:Uncharacterized protein n=1 Tax=Pedobacter jamesrossensis TaxID=1908238 RepID=A0ABV8NNF6_9SPHI
MIEPNTKLLLLKIIKFNGDVTPLLNLDYDYVQISGLIQKEIEDKNAEYNKGNLFLTEKGNLLIQKLEKDRDPGSSSWIEPELASKITPIEKDFVYLPNRKELSF